MYAFYVFTYFDNIWINYILIGLYVYYTVKFE